MEIEVEYIPSFLFSISKSVLGYVIMIRYALTRNEAAQVYEGTRLFG